MRYDYHKFLAHLHTKGYTAQQVEKLYGARPRFPYSETQRVSQLLSSRTPWGMMPLTPAEAIDINQVRSQRGFDDRGTVVSRDSLRYTEAMVRLMRFLQVDPNQVTSIDQISPLVSYVVRDLRTIVTRHGMTRFFAPDDSPGSKREPTINWYASFVSRNSIVETTIKANNSLEMVLKDPDGRDSLIEVRLAFGEDLNQTAIYNGSVSDFRTEPIIFKSKKYPKMKIIQQGFVLVLQDAVREFLSALTTTALKE